MKTEMEKTKRILWQWKTTPSPMTQGNNSKSTHNSSTLQLHKQYVWLNMTVFKFYINYKYSSTKAPAKKVCTEGEDRD